MATTSKKKPAKQVTEAEVVAAKDPGSRAWVPVKAERLPARKVTFVPETLASRAKGPKRFVTFFTDRIRNPNKG